MSLKITAKKAHVSSSPELIPQPPINRLPDDLIREIITFLDTYSLDRISSVAKKYSVIMKSDDLRIRAAKVRSACKYERWLPDVKAEDVDEAFTMPSVDEGPELPLLDEVRRCKSVSDYSEIMSVWIREQCNMLAKKNGTQKVFQFLESLSFEDLACVKSTKGFVFSLLEDGMPESVDFPLVQFLAYFPRLEEFVIMDNDDTTADYDPKAALSDDVLSNVHTTNQVRVTRPFQGAARLDSVKTMFLVPSDNPVEGLSSLFQKTSELSTLILSFSQLGADEQFSLPLDKLSSPEKLEYLAIRYNPDYLPFNKYGKSLSPIPRGPGLKYIFRYTTNLKRLHLEKAYLPSDLLDQLPHPEKIENLHLNQVLVSPDFGHFLQKLDNLSVLELGPFYVKGSHFRMRSPLLLLKFLPRKR